MGVKAVNNVVGEGKTQYNLEKNKMRVRFRKIGGGASILMYTHYMKKPKYTYTLIYINIHKLSFYSALSVNHIMHLNDVFEELLHCINSFDGRFVDI